MDKSIQDYNNSQSSAEKEICELLKKIIDGYLLGAESKVWHGSPAWFLEGNPVVGYAKRKDNVTLLFWSGQSFDEPGLHKEGSFKAAEAKYTDVEQTNESDLKRWLKKARQIQWD